MNSLEIHYIKSIIKKRDSFSHKGDHGHALLIAGHKGYMGAAVIAAKAGLRSGVGLLTVSVPSDERLILQTSLPEAMLAMREDKQYHWAKFSAVGIGPGLGIDTSTEELLIDVLSKVKVPLVLDADALTLISMNKALLNDVPHYTVITPHAAEFDRLFGLHEDNDARIQTAIQKAKDHTLIIVLKGHHTVIISPKEIAYNSTGNAGLAKGGSGDALTGVIISFLAQGYTPFLAASLGVYFHGLAADITLKTQSMESMVVTDVIESFGNAFKMING